MADEPLRLTVQTHGRQIGQLKQGKGEIGQVAINSAANQNVRHRRQQQEVQSSPLDLFG